MLKRWLEDNYPKMDPEDIAAMARELRMTKVTEQFEAESVDAVYNLATGKIARNLLLQVAFLKKELLVAMGAIEDLMDANNFNFRLMATVPAFLVTYTMYSAVRRGRTYLLGHKSRFEMYTTLRGLLRDMLRAITHLDLPPTGPGSWSQDRAGTVRLK